MSQCYIYLMNSVQEIKDATKRKLNGLFFIKTKHARPTYKNHHYFEMRVRNNPHPSSNSNSKKWSMFVDQPTSYGIDNTLKYLINSASSPDKSHHDSFKALDVTLPKKKITVKEETSLSKAHSQIHQLQISRVKKQKTDHHGSNSGRDSLLKIKNVYPRSNRVATEPAACAYTKMTLSCMQRLRESNTMYRQTQTGDKQNLQKIDTLKVENQAPEHNVELIYIQGCEDRAFLGNELNVRIRINILPYVIGTFLKCKINYSKYLSQAQYNRICECIEQTRRTKKTHFDVKDLINLGTIYEIQEKLMQYGEGSIQWFQAIRYFFLPHDEPILDYQFMKLIDELKVLAVLKSNVDLADSSIYIYRVEDKMRVHGIHDLMLPGTYIFSSSKHVMEIYNTISKRTSDILSFNNRIKRWRNVAQLDQSDKETNKSVVSDFEGCRQDSSRAKTEVSQVHNFHAQRYQRLYELTKKRHKLKMGQKMSVHQSRISNPHPSFIDRTKLNKSHDIFQ